MLGSVPVDDGVAPAYGVLVDVPWKANIRKYNGIAFKWSVKLGGKKLWFGDVGGDNLSVRTSFAKLVLSSTDGDRALPSHQPPACTLSTRTSKDICANTCLLYTSPSPRD